MLNVLIPTDFSKNAKKAARYAVSVFGKESKYTLLNTYDVPHSGATMLITISDILEKDSLQLLKEELSELEEQYPDLVGNVDVKTAMGQPDVAIKKIADKGACDIVVMGTKGATGLKGVLVGSVAANTMQQLKCPVIAVPEDADAHVPKKILFAADDKCLNEGLFPKELADLAKRFNSEVLVLNVVPEGEMKHVGSGEGSMNQQPISVFDDVKHSLHFVEDKDVNNGIERFIDSHDVDLLAMITRKDDLFSRLFGVSNTKQMMQNAGVPLVAFHS